MADALTLPPGSHAALPRPGAPRRLRDIWRDRSGSAAIEFAIVSGMLISAILFVMVVGLILYIDQALDFATARAARQIMTGYVQKNGVSQSAFRTQYLCPALPSTMSCNDVIVNVQTLVEAAQPGGYYQFVNGGQTALLTPALSNTGASFNPGIQASFVYVQVVYPVTLLPRFMASLFGSATYNGSPAYLATSTAAFRNEQY